MTTITIDRAVLEQALDALDSCDCSETLSGPRQHFDERAVYPALDALRDALNAPQPEPEPEPQPVKREWVDLTDEQIVAICDMARPREVSIRIAQQALKERNHE